MFIHDIHEIIRHTQYIDYILHTTDFKAVIFCSLIRTESSAVKRNQRLPSCSERPSPAERRSGRSGEALVGGARGDTGEDVWRQRCSRSRQQELTLAHLSRPHVAKT